MYEVSSDFVWEMMAWAPGGNEVAVLSSAFPHAALPQSSLSLENRVTGIWSTRGREELARGHGRMDQNRICSGKPFQFASEDTAPLGERPDTSSLARSQTHIKVQ